MRQFEADYPISAAQQRLLTFGAVLFTQNLESCRTLRMTEDRQAVIARLAEWWGIRDRGEALHIAGYLSVAEGHTPSADPIYQNLILRKRLDLVSQEEALDYLLRLEDEDIKDLGIWDIPAQHILSGLESYRAAKAMLIDLGYTDLELSAIPSAAAWDYGRTGLIARCGAKVGYLEEGETWDFLQAAADNATRVYRSWREYLAGYVIGRATGYFSDSRDLSAVLRYLLQNENSPFRAASFH